MVGVLGFEPRASASQTRRATNCATPRYWWAGEESNLHALRHSLLKAACLPFHHPPSLHTLNLNLETRPQPREKTLYLLT